MQNQTLFLKFALIFVEMNRFLTKISMSIAFLLALLLTTPSLSAREFVVVIDAGHGGKDAGAIGANAQEKNINLSVAKLLGDKINSSCDNVKVVYTRDTDKYLTLQQRANIANKANGDLFISIHVNSLDYNVAGREKVSGASVFTLGLHKSEDNLAVAKRENAVIELEKDYSTTYSGFDPNSTESYIIFEMNQNKHMMQSIEFAGAVQKELTSTAGRANKGVRQAGFWVLWATSMPSILVELDFICNPTQEAFLASKDGQEQLATSIFNAFKRYHTTYANSLTDLPMATKNNTNSSANNRTQPPNKNSDKKANKSAEKPTKAEKNVEKKDNKKEEQPIDESESGIIYRIQILTSDKNLEKGSREFKGLYPIWSYRDGSIYKYTYEYTTSFDEAQKILRKVKNKFPQAFIVKFKNGKRIK